MLAVRNFVYHLRRRSRDLERERDLEYDRSRFFRSFLRFSRSSFFAFFFAFLSFFFSFAAFKLAKWIVYFIGYKSSTFQFVEKTNVLVFWACRRNIKNKVLAFASTDFYSISAFVAQMSRIPAFSATRNSVSIRISSWGIFIKSLSVDASKSQLYLQWRVTSYPYSVPASMLCCAVPCWFLPKAMLSSSESDILTKKTIHDFLSEYWKLAISKYG